MRIAVHNSSKGTERTQYVRLSSMVVLHPVTIVTTIHTTGWGKRVLAVPPGASERPAEQHS